MKDFKEVQSYIVDEATKKNACSSELNRVKTATDKSGLLAVISDNLGWVSTNNLFNGANISEFFADEELIAAGLYNSGEGNSGFANTGYSNTGDRNTGVFCTGVQTLPFFDKPSDWTLEDFQNCRAFSVMSRPETKFWVWPENMNEAEKKANPQHETTGGYLKDIPIKEAWTNLWGNLSDTDKNSFKELPNWDSKIFESITGIKF